jgi:phosphoserine phosphatase
LLHPSLWGFVVRIAFDLDDTLIPSAHFFPVEAPVRPWLAHLVDGELLRRGTGRVLRHLTERGCTLWVYTTSFRSPFYLKVLFFA